MVTRRRFLQFLALAAVAGALPGPHGIVSPDGAQLRSSADRAVAAYHSLQAFLYRPNIVPGDRTSLYVDLASFRAARLYAYLWSLIQVSSLWPFSQATAATLDLMGLPFGLARFSSDVRDRIHIGLPRYWDGTAHRCSILPAFALLDGSRYYDDNAWVGLSLVRAHRLTRDPFALDRAQRVFHYVTTGWHRNPGEPSSGGVCWVEHSQNQDRNTCSNAPNTELGLRLYQLTEQKSYLDWAKRMYDWVNDTLLAPNGLYWDRIDMQGYIEKTQWSYNQGTMIGAGTLLYTITGDPTYLERARSTASAALDYYGGTGYSGQPPIFNAIFFRNLLHLSTVDPAFRPATLQAMQQYADDAWQHNRRTANLFFFPASSLATTLLDQAAMVQILACLAWDPAQYDLLV